MSPEEALILLNLQQEDPLDEQLEQLFFELKQKIYRQLDQVLLYPKWIKELSRLDTAAHGLGCCFPEEKLTLTLEGTIDFDSIDRSMLAQFSAQHQLRSKIAFSIYNGKSPIVLNELLAFWLEQQKNFFEFWAGAYLPKLEILLSQQFDPQLILGLLNELQSIEITAIEDLSEANTPLPLQQYIAWNKAVWAKLNNA
jgi:hypothetical protein